MRFSIILGGLLAAASLSAADRPAGDLEARRQALKSLLDEQWQYTLSTNPEFASILGDKRWNDKSSDTTPAAVARDLAKSAEFLKRFESIDTTGFPEQEELNKRLMVRNLREQQENAPFRSWEMPVNQMSGIHLGAASFPAFLAFDSAKDFDDYIARLRNFPGQMDGVTESMRLGMKDGLMPPKFLLEKVVTQTRGIAEQAPEKSPFAEPLTKMPKSVPAAEQDRIRKDLVAAVRDSVLPAYARFAKFLAQEYVPKGRSEPGMWSLPDGEARYAAAVKSNTTTNLTPEEIHRIGLAQVSEIEVQMLGIAKKMGFSSLKAFNASLEKNPDLHAKTGEQILDLYRHYIDQMYGKLPQLFGRLPKMKVEVKPVEAFREKEAAGAEYNQGTQDGSRPGRVEVNTSDPHGRKTISMESTAYHEGVPGHHMQISIQQELPTIPPFRQQGGYTAYSEGWALYSERLGKEVGFYQNPYNDYGRLQDEMLRAIRLVVDTGFHAKRWTREQVVQFFHDHSGTDEVEVQSETDRYIVWPGQALGYKIGQLKILELRDRAKKALGDRFDLRKFHDEILGAGALPMDVLEKRIGSWIASQKP